MLNILILLYMIGEHMMQIMFSVPPFRAESTYHGPVHLADCIKDWVSTMVLGVTFPSSYNLSYA